MKSAKEIHSWVGIPLVASYVDRMVQQGYRCFTLADIEAIQKEAYEEGKLAKQSAEEGVTQKGYVRTEGLQE